MSLLLSEKCRDFHIVIFTKTIMIIFLNRTIIREICNLIWEKVSAYFWLELWYIMWATHFQLMMYIS